jgi:glucosamine--fructose-6-phosphate aminotransferase (isomerizing)
MCGIVGYIGDDEAIPALLSGLRKLEYRGYDSAGVAVLGPAGLAVRKAKGRLGILEGRIQAELGAGPGGGTRPEGELSGKLGIGHTRWATHGEPSDLNSHPHTDVSGSIAVVHNGIIENHERLRAWLRERGVTFRSETDTEVIAHLINHYYSGDLLGAVREALRRLEGSYALGIISAKAPDRIIAARKESPLVVGLGAAENLFASDVPALLDYTREVYYLEDREIAELYRDRIAFYNEEGRPVDKQVQHIDWDAGAAEKGGYEHFMLKEIHEQPRALNDTLRGRILEDPGRGEPPPALQPPPASSATPPTGGSAPRNAPRINLEETGPDESWLKAGRVVIAACGTAWHAAVIGKYLFERLARLPTDAEIASEFRYRDPIYSPGDIFIIISQSGETADTLAAMRLAKRKGARIIAVTNVVGSTLAREADWVMYTRAGPEIAVASTKAFTAQIMSLNLMALRAGFLRGIIGAAELEEMLRSLEETGAQAERLLAEKDTIQRCAARQFNKSKVFFMGRLFDYAVSLESALKLKEISYTHSEAFAAGELKHGPIALVDPATLVVAICTQEELFDKMDSNIKEVKARGAQAAVITFADVDRFDSLADEVFRIPRTPAAFAPILAVIPAQLFAYYCAVLRGLDPDKPRNLAKSVTVE